MMNFDETRERSAWVGKLRKPDGLSSGECLSVLQKAVDRVVMGQPGWGSSMSPALKQNLSGDVEVRAVCRISGPGEVLFPESLVIELVVLRDALAECLADVQTFLWFTDGLRLARLDEALPGAN